VRDMGFRENWVNFLHKTALGTKKMRTFLTPIGVIIFGIFTTLFVLAAIFVDRLLQLPGILPAYSIIPLSVPVMTVGVALTAWSAFHFLKIKGTPVPFNPPPKLVKTGPYRYIRNPMLTGVFLILTGLGLFINSFSLVIFFTPLFVLINVWELKRIEEPELIRRLGEAYIQYRRKTPMFLPSVRKRLKKDS